MPPTTTFLLPHSRVRLWATAIGAGIFLLIGAAMFLAALHAGLPGSALILFMSVVELLFFGTFLSWSVRRLRDGAPAFRIDEAGLLDDRTINAAGWVPWSEIERVFERPGGVQRVLCLLPHDTGAFLASRPPWKRLFLRANMRMGYTPAVVASAGLPIGFDEMTARIQEAFGRATADNHTG